MPRVKAELRTAPVRTSGLCTRVNKCGRVEVLRAIARCGHSRRIEVGNFLRTPRIAYIEHAHPGVEIGACERGCIVFVIDAAIMASVRENRQADDIGQHRAAICRIVCFQQHARDDFGMPFVSDVDDPRHREHGQTNAAGRLHICGCISSAAAEFIHPHEILSTFDRDRNVHLTLGTVGPKQMAHFGDLRIGHTRLNLADVENEDAVIAGQPIAEIDV